MKFSHCNPLKVLYLFGITLLLLMWLEQRSISAYWIQTYHKSSPLATLDNYSAWQLGGKMTSYLNLGLKELKEQIAYFDDKSIMLIDSCINSFMKQQSFTDLPSLQDKSEDIFKLLDSSVFQPLSFVKDLQLNGLGVRRKDSLVYFSSFRSSKSITKTQGKKDYRILVDKGDKVFFVGDSLMQGVAPYVMRTLMKQHNIESINLSKQSTGLTYIRFFNWPQVAKETFEKNPDIKLMIVFMGANDPWDFPVIKGGKFVKFGTPEWEGVYRARIQTLINAATDNGAKVLWIGAPNMRDKKLNEGVIELNKIYKSQVTIAKQYYVTSNDVLGMKDNNFVKFMNIPNKGNVTLRTDDGIHFTPIGQKLIANKIISLLRFTDNTETTK